MPRKSLLGWRRFQVCVTMILATMVCACAHAGRILAVDLGQANPETRLLVASIQGVVNRDPAEVGVYVLQEPHDGLWLTLYRPEVEVVTPEELLAQARERLAGQVLYDAEQEHSVNLAAAAAAILDAALTPSDLGLETLFDARGRWPDRASAYRYAVAQVLAESAPDRIALVGADHIALRDYLARERVLAVDLGWRTPAERDVLREILVRLQPGSLVFGSPAMTADDDLLALLAEHQHALIPIGAASNLSYHAAQPLTATLHQMEGLAPPALTVMVTFVYEGGADPAFALGRMRELWEDPARGTVPLGWTMSPALLELAPAVMQSYYAGARLSGADEFVLAPNGPGYFVPSVQANWEHLHQRLSRWRRAGDFRVAAIADAGPELGLRRALRHYIAAGIGGVLLGPGAELTSGMYDDLPLVVQAIRATDAYQALRAIREAADANKYIYVSVDPWALTPGDIAHIALRLGARFTVLRPREFLEVARHTSATGAQRPAEGKAVISGIAIGPEQPGPTDRLQVRASVRSDARLDSVRAVYTLPRLPGEWSVPMYPEPEERYLAALPPALEGGRMTVRIRAVDVQNRITWSAPAGLTVRAPDGDGDGLSDALEALLRSDPAHPDTDGDGWRDGNDVRVLVPDQFVPAYIWPLWPPGDQVYITDGGGSVGEEGLREVTGEEQVVYRLPLANVPSGARPLLHVIVGGDYRLEASADRAEWREAAAAEDDAPLQPAAWEIPADLLGGPYLWLRVTDSTPGEGAPARVLALSVTGHPHGPSLLPVGTDPSFPAAGLPVEVLAVAFTPGQVADVRLHYRIGDGGVVVLPMSERGASQVYAAAVRVAMDGDRVTYWVSATDGEENVAMTRPRSLHVGTVRRETVSLLAGRDFEGEWAPAEAWDGSRWSPRAGAADRATANLSGGSYRVWVLAAPRGGGLRVTAGGSDVGAVTGSAADGWQSVGTVTLERGRHEVVLRAAEADAGYAQVMLTADRLWMPPENMVCDLFNSVTILRPLPGETVSGLVEIEVTATGNVGAVACYVDGALVGRETRAPYRFRWNARRAAPGSRTIEARAYDHAGDLLLTAAMQVEVAP